MKVTSPPSQSNNKYYPLFAMLFVTLAICDVLLVYRLVSFSSLTLTAGVFVMPIYYMIEDVVTFHCRIALDRFLGVAFFNKTEEAP